MDIQHVKNTASLLGELARPFMKKRPQLCEVLRSGRGDIVAAPSFAAILPSLKSTDWYRTVEGEAPVEVRKKFLELIEMICALPHDDREPAIQQALSSLYESKDKYLHPA